MQAGNVQGAATTLGLFALQAPKPGSLPSYDPRDANRDGMVSFGEANSYSLRHPEVAIVKQLRSPREPVAAPLPAGPRPAPFAAAPSVGPRPLASPAPGPGPGSLDLLA